MSSDDLTKCSVDGDEKTTSASASAMMMIRKKLGSWKDTARVAIVSASYGGRGANTKLPQRPPDVRCILYTDRQVAEDGGWNVIFEQYHANSDRFGSDLKTEGRYSWNKIDNPKIRNTMAAKFYKLNMFLLPELEGIHNILWHDAEWEVDWFHSEVSLADRITQLLTGHPFVIEKHYQRNTVSSEIEPAATRARDTTGHQNSSAEIHEAYDHFLQLGFTDNALYNGARFLVDSNSADVRTAFKSWWHVCQDFTFRDQISLPFIVQHFNLNVRVLENRHLHKTILGDMDIALSHRQSTGQRLQGNTHQKRRSQSSKSPKGKKKEKLPATTN